MSNNRPAVVYVVNCAGHNTDTAKAFGELHILTKDKVNVFASDRLTTELTDELKAFDSTKDYLLLSGAIILNMIAMKAILARGAKSVKVLLYNFHLGRYIVRVI